MNAFKTLLTAIGSITVAALLLTSFLMISLSSCETAKDRKLKSMATPTLTIDLAVLTPDTIFITIAEYEPHGFIDDERLDTIIMEVGNVIIGTTVYDFHYTVDIILDMMKASTHDKTYYVNVGAIGFHITVSPQELTYFVARRPFETPTAFKVALRQKVEDYLNVLQPG